MQFTRALSAAFFVCVMCSASLAQVCVEQMPPIMPIGPQFPAIAYDTMRERLLVFAQASVSNNAPNEGLWEYSGGEWQCLDCPATSVPRFTIAAQAVYDEARDRFMLMRSPTAAYEYDGESWTLRNFAGVSFAFPNSSWSVTYNSDAGRTIITGAGPGGVIRLFSYDGVQSVQLPDPPTPAGYGSIAYDTVRHVLVLVARSGNNVQTWEFDGNSWTQRATGGPLIATFSQLAFDEARGRTVTVVGQNTYEWDGVAWTTSPVAPVRDWSGRAVFDPAAQRVVAWTRSSGDSPFLPIWRASSWTGMAWQYESGPELSDRASAYAQIPGTDRGYLFGGSLAVDPTLFWEFDGTSIQPLSDEGPSARLGAALAWDSVRSRLVLFGGVSPDWAVQFRDTWEWSAATGWQLRATSGPVANVEASMTFDEARGVVVKVGGANAGNGTYIDETWEWDGDEWTNRNVTGPGSRASATLVYCADLRSCLLTFGARFPADANSSSDVWQWDGEQWLRFPGNEVGGGESYPAIRSAYYDTTRRRIVAPDPSTQVDFTIFWDVLERRWDFAIGTGYPLDIPWNSRMPYLPELDAFAMLGGTYESPDTFEKPISRIALHGAQFMSDPQASRYIEGDTIVLSDSLSDTTASDTYRWYRGFTPLNDHARYSGSATPTLTIIDAQPADAGEYRLRAVTPCGAVVSAAATIQVLPPCDGDVSGDRVVDLLDLAILLTNFGTPSGASRAMGDLDYDDDVDLTDLAILLANFGAPCE